MGLLRFDFTEELEEGFSFLWAESLEGSLLKTFHQGDHFIVEGSALGG